MYVINISIARFVEMAEHEALPPAVDDDDNEDTPGYKPPAPKSLNEIQNLDQEDESLKKYKDALLGQATNAIIGNFRVPPVALSKYGCYKVDLGFLKWKEAQGSKMLSFEANYF